MDIVLSLESHEHDIITACVNNERWAQQKIYEEYYGKMVGVCLRYATNFEDAQDIAHDGFIKIFKNIGKYNIGTSLHSWIKRIMVNTCIDYYRKQKRRRTEDIDTAFDLSSDEADAISKVSEKEILEVIQTLSPSYRLVFNLYVIDGYSHREVAKRLDINESTSRSNLVKARSKLKEAILAKRNYGE